MQYLIKSLTKGPTKSLPKALTALLIILLTAVAGCASNVVVNVNAITDASKPLVGKRYYLTNTLENTQHPDLYFQEFRRYFDHILQKQGYEKSDTRENANLEILFSYGISDGRTGVYTYSWPVYETFGGETVTITEKTTDSGGSITTTKRTVHIPAYTRQVGNSYETRSYTLYNRYANLAAFPVNNGAVNKGTVNQGSVNDGTVTNTKTPVWTVNLHSVGESNDLRATMPYLAAASSTYIAKNSGRQQSVSLDKENVLLIQLKQLIPNQP